MSQDHFTVFDLAQIFRYHPDTIRRWIRQGRIHAFRVGAGKKASWRILPIEVERLRVVGFEEQMEELKKAFES